MLSHLPGALFFLLPLTYTLFLQVLAPMSHPPGSRLGQFSLPQNPLLALPVWDLSPPLGSIIIKAWAEAVLVTAVSPAQC